jgi:5'(3')-deoxyribonucleotidase
MRILIDMDDVMADAVARFFDWYERDFGVLYTKDDIHGKKLSEIVPEENRQTVLNYPHQKGFFKNLPVIENAKEIIEILNNLHEIYVVSAAMEFKYSFIDKYEWLDEHFPFIPWKRRIFCGNKHLIKGDVLIDDHDFNLSVFPGRPIVFTAPHNVHYKEYERMENWLDAKNFFDDLA